MSVQRKIIAQRDDLQVVQEYDNQFKDIYPFNEIGRVIMESSTGNILRVCHPDDSNYDVDGNPININQSTEELMVKFPAFYYKKIYEGDMYTESILDLVPGDIADEIDGYKVHPAFIRPDGTVRPYVLMSTVTGLRSDIYNAGGVLYNSLESVRKDLRKNRLSVNFNSWTIDTFYMLITLFYVAFQTRFSDEVLPANYYTVNKNNCNFFLSIGNKTGMFVNTIDGSKCAAIFGIQLWFGTMNKSSSLEGFVINQKDFSVWYSNNPELYGQYSNYERVEVDIEGMLSGLWYAFGRPYNFSNTSIYHTIFPKDSIGSFYTRVGWGLKKTEEDNYVCFNPGSSAQTTMYGGVGTSVSSSIYSCARICFLP